MRKVLVWQFISSRWPFHVWCKCINDRDTRLKCTCSTNRIQPDMRTKNAGPGNFVQMSLMNMRWWQEHKYNTYIRAYAFKASAKDREIKHTECQWISEWWPNERASEPAIEIGPIHNIERWRRICGHFCNWHLHICGLHLSAHCSQSFCNRSARDISNNAIMVSGFVSSCISFFFFPWAVAST